MKIIDLLNKIANGEEVPKKIKIETHIFTKFNYSMGDGTFVPNYESNNDGEYYINDFLYPQYLNNEIEILEEEKKIPEKIKSNGKEFYCDNIDSWIDKEKTSAYCEYLMNKYNDLIDYLKSKGE